MRMLSGSAASGQGRSGLITERKSCRRSKRMNGLRRLLVADRRAWCARRSCGRGRARCPAGRTLSVPLQAVVHVLGARSRQVDAAARADEQRVAGHQVAVDQEALRARRVPGRVQELHLEVADLDRRRRASVSTMSESDSPAMRCANGASLLWRCDLDGQLARSARRRPGSPCPSSRRRGGRGGSGSPGRRRSSCRRARPRRRSRRCPRPRRPPRPRASRGRRSGRRSSASGRLRAAGGRAVTPRHAALLFRRLAAGLRAGFLPRRRPRSQRYSGVPPCSAIQRDSTNSRSDSRFR